MSTTPAAYILGLDLGQASDYSALCVVERTSAADPEDGSRAVHSFGVRHLHRWKLGTPYPEIVEDVRALAACPPLPGSPLAVDATGVGRPVVDLLRQAKLPLWLVPVVITAGNHEGESDGYRTVPKLNLVAVMQTLVQARRFHVAPALPEARTLARELQAFRVKVNLQTGNETFEAWRSRDHDDLVLAVALACWLGSRPQHGPPEAGGERTTSYSAPMPGGESRFGWPGGSGGLW